MNFSQKNDTREQFLLIVFIAFLIFGFISRFYNLTWGAPFYFHPDERNILYAVLQLSFPSQMNPHFFAYGSFPIYTIYFTGISITRLFHIPFDLAFVACIARGYSALLSLLLIPLIYKIGSKFFSKRIGFISGLLATTSVGLIQFAHFGTFEVWNTFFSALLFYQTLCVIKKGNMPTVVLSAFIAGFLLGIKVSNVVIIPLPILGIFIATFRQKHSFINKTSIQQGFVYSAILFFVYLATNPYVLFDFQNFYNSIRYESSVALGTISVFYTGGFYQTRPILFQLLHVYPFLINPFVEIMFVVSIFCILWIYWKTRESQYGILLMYFTLLFISQGILFVKWTRYMLPTLPFMYISIAVALSKASAYVRKYQKDFVQIVSNIIVVVLVSISVIYSFSYIKTVLIDKNSVVTAANFAYMHLPKTTQLLIEPFDLGALPFNEIFTSITSFPFYDLDQNPRLVYQLSEQLITTDAIILPSQRLYRSRLINGAIFPQGNKFYLALQNGTLGYKKIYQTPCDIFCTILYMGNPIFSFEETISVFDHPTVFIFKKEQFLSQTDYLKLLQK